MILARFQIAELPPGHKAHYMEVHRAKVRWERVLRAQAKEQQVVEAQRGERRVVIVEMCRPSTQDMDRDNRYARLKVPLDVLTRAHGRKQIGLGVLWDDDEAHVDVHAFCVNEPRRRTVITVCAPGSDPDAHRSVATTLSLL